MTDNTCKSCYYSTENLETIQVYNGKVHVGKCLRQHLMGCGSDKKQMSITFWMMKFGVTNYV